MKQIDPKLDLYFERVVDVPKEKIWQCWTQPEKLLPWFCPAPWKAVECEIDLKPGGRFYTVMQSPDGGLMPNTGTYLEITENHRLVWTNVVLPGFRPAVANAGGFAMTAIIELEDSGSGTKYSAHVMHENRVARQQHAEMGFEQGWGTALDQMVAMIKAGT